MGDGGAMDSLIELNAVLCNDLWMVVLLVMVALGLFFTFRTRGLQITMIPEMVRQIASRRKSKGDSDGTLRGLKAFWMSMGCRVGIGNIAGVAAAVVVGGPGTIFWMWVFVILVSVLSFAENTLGQIYKERFPDGTVRGGASFYTRNGLGKPLMAMILSVMLIVLMLSFCGSQANQACASITAAVPSLDPLVVGIALAAIIALSFISGVKKIADISNRVVPVMVVIYLVIVLAIIITNFSKIGAVFSTIFEYAFGVRPFIGGSIATMLIWGLKRTVFSTDVGTGLMPNLTASGEASHPVETGLVQAFGNYMDILICTATGIVILLYTNDVYPDYDFTGLAPEVLDSLKGAPMVSAALSNTFLGDFGPIILAVFLGVFAYTTILAHTFNCESNVLFLTGNTKAAKAVPIVITLLVLVFSQLSLQLVWDIADIVLGIVSIINLVAVVMLARPVLEALADFRRQKEESSGTPVFSSDVLSDDKGVTNWPPR